jgi:hypothetical protein
MEGLQLEVYKWLLELENDEAASFVKSCTFETVWVDVAFGISDDVETVINDIYIFLPLKLYKAIDQLTVSTKAVEDTLREIGQSQGDYYRNIEWKPMLPTARVKAVESVIIVDHNFINEQIAKCRSKLEQADYNGAITNARSLVEAVCIELIERSEGKEVRSDGNLINLWAKTKKIMNLEIGKTDLPETVTQILGGLDTAVKGFAGLSNNAGDRHANKFKTRLHHAKLAVNLALALSDFLFESADYQQLGKTPNVIKSV